MPKIPNFFFRIFYALGFFLLFFGFFPEKGLRSFANIYVSEQEKGTVAVVYDGDTVEVEFSDGRKRRIRLIGINAPETGHSDEQVCFPWVQPGGDRECRNRASNPVGVCREAIAIVGIVDFQFHPPGDFVPGTPLVPIDVPEAPRPFQQIGMLTLTASMGPVVPVIGLYKGIRNGGIRIPLCAPK